MMAPRGRAQSPSSVIRSLGEDACQRWCNYARGAAGQSIARSDGSPAPVEPVVQRRARDRHVKRRGGLSLRQRERVGELAEVEEERLPPAYSNGR